MEHEFLRSVLGDEILHTVIEDELPHSDMGDEIQRTVIEDELPGAVVEMSSCEP